MLRQDGWIEVPSRSRPGCFSYKNMHTDEAIDWFPYAKASQTSGDLPPPSKDARADSR